jgi:hypothetical protein
MDFALCIAKVLYLCASKPSIKSLLTPRIKAAIIYNKLRYEYQPKNSILDFSETEFEEHNT